MYGISEVVARLERNDYSEHLSPSGYELDCSLGQNPYGAPPGLAVSSELPTIVGSYPHSEAQVKQAIMERFGSMSPLEPPNIALTCGSMGALICLNRLFLKKGKRIIGVAPQFTAIVDDFNVYEAEYRPVPLRADENYRFDADAFLAVLQEERDAFVYIDNPNNPTGQIIALEDIERIVAVARDRGSFVCVDEAYGDYMANANSAIQILEHYDNLCVTRTLSKGLGGAGLRMGYLMSGERFVRIFEKVNIPFATTGLANYLAPQLLRSGWEHHAVERSLADKAELIGSLRHIKVGHTAMEVPIGMYYVDEDVDLEQAMLRHGLRVVSCSGYVGLSRNAVRINLHKNFERMKELVLEVDRELGGEG